jgi:tyrosyl-DNA phosphodiesterase 2
MATNKLWRALSAFNPSTRMWAPISSRNAQTQRLSLTSWNIDAFSSRAISRAELILGHILKGLEYPDIFLQEVTPGVRAFLLDDARVRAAFLVTDAEDQTSFEKVPFATMTLLSSARFSSGLDLQKEGDGVERGEKFMLGRVSRLALPASIGGMRFM